jgi:hypothetical protein
MDTGPMMEKPMSNLQVALERMEGEVNEIENQAERLTNDLGSVMMPEATAPAASKSTAAPDAPKSGLTNRLDGFNRRLSGVAVTLRMIRERLDV